MRMGESAQDYLEAIHILSKKLDYVRAIDICSYFGYARATVSVFLKQLKASGFVDIDAKNHVTLTETGNAIAMDVYDRHRFLSNFFTSIGVPEDIAAEDACRIEHHVSDETFEALKKKFAEFDTTE